MPLNRPCIWRDEGNHCKNPDCPKTLCTYTLELDPLRWECKWEKQPPGVQRTILAERPEAIAVTDNHGTCCVCGHALSSHIDEGELWRCHSLGPDTYQCECILRKNKAGDEGIAYYDLGLREEEAIAELRDEWDRWDRRKPAERTATAEPATDCDLSPNKRSATGGES